jgi:hypothetical protein
VDEARFILHIARFLYSCSPFASASWLTIHALSEGQNAWTWAAALFSLNAETLAIIISGVSATNARSGSMSRQAHSSSQKLAGCARQTE